MSTWSEDFGGRLRSVLARSTKSPVPPITNDANCVELAERIEARIIASSDIIGPRGAQGQTGPQGITGNAGPVGPMGPGGTGPIGAQGPQGIKGDTGNVGPIGPQGPIGPAGIAGPIGAQGAKGDTGDAGAIGPQGPIGATGTQGIQGIKGDTGNVGPQGVQGLTGGIGPTGSQGPIGPAGAQGIKGDPGNVGPIGPQGSIGPTGSTGAQGPIGLTGSVGLQGVQGPAGPAALAHAIRAASPKIAGASGCLALGTQALTAARQYFIPFVVAKTATITALRASVTTSVAASTLSFGIYSNSNSGGDDLPGALLASSIAQSSATTGDKTGVVALTLTAGTLYWASVICSAAATLRALTLGGIQTALGFTVGATTAVTHLFAAGAGSALPPVAPGSLTEGVTAIPALYLVGG